MAYGNPGSLPALPEEIREMVLFWLLPRYRAGRLTIQDFGSPVTFEEAIHRIPAADDLAKDQSDQGYVDDRVYISLSRGLGVQVPHRC